MTPRENDRQLGRRYTHARRRLLRLPKRPLCVEVDFCPLPDIAADECVYWLGMVVDQDNGLIRMATVGDQPPRVDDAADLLCHAIAFPHPRGPCRPEVVFFRDNPTWEPLFPFLERLEIKTVITEDLLHWDARAEELTEWTRRRWSPMPEFRTEIHEQLGVFNNLSELRGLAYGFLCFGPRKHE